MRRVGNDEAAEKGKSWAKTSPETNFIDPIFISLQLVVSLFPSPIADSATLQRVLIIPKINSDNDVERQAKLSLIAKFPHSQ